MRDKERRKLITNAKVQRLGPRLIIRATTNTKEMTNRPPIFTTSRQRWTLHWSIKSTSCETSARNHTLKCLSNFNWSPYSICTRTEKCKHTHRWPPHYQSNLKLGTPLCIVLFCFKVSDKKIHSCKKEKSCTSAFRCDNANEVDYKGY